jgi:hypothetical protein
MTGCTYNKFEVKPLDGPVSFQKDILPIFDAASCAQPGCHGGDNPNGGLNLGDDKAYTQLTTKGYINTAEPEISILYLRLSDNSSPMPPTGQLPASSLNKILDWIKQGAKNN